MGRLAALGVVGVLAARVAAADVAWHAGLDLRIDAGAHPIRIGGGVQRGRLDTLLVLDPMFWTDHQIDTDLLASWRVTDRGWAVLGGWRTTAIGILGGHEVQEKLVLGVSAPLPRLGCVRARWAVELATVIVKHGAGLPAEWISFETGRDFVDLLNFGMFVTFEVGRAH